MSPTPPPPRTRLRTAAAALLALTITTIMALVATPSAFAVQSARTTVSNSGTVCVQGIAAFNWTTSGFADRSSSAQTFARTPGCGPTLYRQNGWMAARFDVFKLVNGSWSVCVQGPWVYGGGGDIHSGDITYEQRVITSRSYSSPPCGAGTYGTVGYHYVWNGSAWEGNSLWSGSMNAA